MSYQIQCRSCGRQVSGTALLAGKTVTCPKCQNWISVPAIVNPGLLPATPPQTMLAVVPRQPSQGFPKSISAELPSQCQRKIRFSRDRLVEFQFRLFPRSRQFIHHSPRCRLRREYRFPYESQAQHEVVTLDITDNNKDV